MRRRTISSPNLTLIRLYLPELLHPNPPNWAQLGQQVKKNRSIFRVKLRMTNIHKLKVVDPETMEKCGCLRLCEIFCGLFGPTPEGNLGPIFQIVQIRVLGALENVVAPLSVTS